jgi:hypothetical protein
MTGRLHRRWIACGIVVILSVALAAPGWARATVRALPQPRRVASKAATPAGNLGVTVLVVPDPVMRYDTWLAQNFPNGFTSSTVIRYSLARPSRISIIVYSITGQKVTTLIDWYQNAGGYSLRWDGRGDDGRPLASGIYLYRMVGAGRVFSRKMTVIH